MRALLLVRNDIWTTATGDDWDLHRIIMIQKPGRVFFVFALAWSCLTSIVHLRPVCEKLLHPLDQVDPQIFQGGLAFVAGSLSHQPSLDALKQRDSITVYFSNSTEGSRTTYTQINRFGDQCQSRLYNISMEDSRFNFDVANRFELRASFRYTSCPDCVVMKWLVNSEKRQSVELYLLSRRRQVEQKEMEEFLAQLWCYGLPPPVVMDPTKELCPKEPQNTTIPVQKQDQWKAFGKRTCPFLKPPVQT